jgi:methyl-branched lipid omega-hydroxylase
MKLGDEGSWHRPLQARMDDFAAMREAGPFAQASLLNILTGQTDEYYAVTRYAELVEISRRSQDFCTGRRSISIIDMPSESRSRSRRW